MKKLEEQLSEANRRGDDLQRALTELSVAKNRLTGTDHLLHISPHVLRQLQLDTTSCSSHFTHA